MRRKCLITKAPGPVPSPFGTSQCRRRLCVPQPYMLTYLSTQAASSSQRPPSPPSVRLLLLLLHPHPQTPVLYPPAVSPSCYVFLWTLPSAGRVSFIYITECVTWLIPPFAFPSASYCRPIPLPSTYLPCSLLSPQPTSSPNDPFANPSPSTTTKTCFPRDSVTAPTPDPVPSLAASLEPTWPPSLTTAVFFQ
ncbi:hypothetical protein K456DRAFT_195709 [Colletotrichum gloeosporioides 23]|nr:hypothetical protein K456DRAFT_195709 [Colletotrichum gloeosporioides 23]